MHYKVHLSDEVLGRILAYTHIDKTMAEQLAEIRALPETKKGIPYEEWL